MRAVVEREEPDLVLSGKLAVDDECGQVPAMLAGLLGWAGGEDTLALVPRSDVCAPVLERGVASMEYRASGRLVLTLVGNAGQCPLHGFARPQDS